MESQVPFRVYSIKTHNAPLIKEAAPVFFSNYTLLSLPLIVLTMLSSIRQYGFNTEIVTVSSGLLML